MQLKVGDKAPDFNLMGQDGEMHSLKDYDGKWLLLYFYPTDDTPGCTTEACTFRDNLPKFADLKAEVVGISIQNYMSHARFARKYQLPFTLLADSEKKTVQDYQVWATRKVFGREFFGTVRTSFLINPEGKIAKIYERAHPLRHPPQVLEDLASLQ